MPDNLLCCFLEIQLKKLDKTVCFCNRLLAAKYPKIQFKVDSLLSCLSRVNTGSLLSCLFDSSVIFRCVKLKKRRQTIPLKIVRN